MNVRIIAATNINLEEAVSSGSFRADLCYRLNVFAINLSLLKERGSEIILLSDLFLNKFTRDL